MGVKPTITICDHLFLEHTQSASIGGENIGIGPTHFKWKFADAKDARFVTDSDLKHARGEGQIAWLLEPPDLHPENYDIANQRRNEFDAVLAHSYPRMMSAKWYPYGGSWIPLEKWGMQDKLYDVSILLSNKHTMRGHKLRRLVVDVFGDRIDVFEGIPDKYEALAPYRYSIIIESQSAPDYFSEKLIDCMSVGTMPIYYGSPNIGQHFHQGGIMQVWGISDISSALDRANERHYNLCKMKLVKNLMVAKGFRICEDNIYEMYPELFQ